MTKYIHNYIFLSILIHSILFLPLLISIRNSVTVSKGTTFVDIIEEKVVVPPSNPDSIKNSDNIREAVKTKESTTKSLKKPPTHSKENEKILEERISALKAKKDIIERAKSSISRSERGISPTSNLHHNINKEVSQSYLSLISGLIREKWSLPETVPKNLEAIVTVKILPNGQAIIEGFEKKSGNALFDSSVIRAINSSLPLPKPHKEITVGLRFKP